MYFSIEITIDMIIKLLPYIKSTLFIAVLGFICAFILAIFISIITYLKVPILTQLVSIYISFNRSIPVLSQLYLVFYGMPQIWEQLTEIAPMYFLIAVLATTQSSFIAETLRGAFLSISKGQLEAGLSCGMTKIQTIKTVIFPQVFRISFPGMSNTFIGMIKGTSVGFTIGVMELMSKSKNLGMRGYRLLESYVAVSLIYWALVIVASQIQKRIEHKLDAPYVK